MRQRWEAASVVLMAALVGLGLYQFYSAIMYAEIRSKWRWTSLEADPSGFWLAVLLNAAGIILLGGLLLLVPHGWRLERRSLSERRRKPTIHSATHRSEAER